jgi:hypothetical protein
MDAMDFGLYGAVDVGLQFDTHGTPISDYYVFGTGAFIRPNSSRAVFGSTPNNLSQSLIGVYGRIHFADTWSAEFRVETFFNPQSGQLSDGPKSLTLNNGRPGQEQRGLDSSVAGQLFQTAYISLGSSLWGLSASGASRRCSQTALTSTTLRVAPAPFRYWARTGWPPVAEIARIVA